MFFSHNLPQTLPLAVSLSHLSDYRKIILICGQNSARQPAFSALKSHLSASFTLTEYVVQGRLPVVSEVADFQKRHPGSDYIIVAVGGGRIMDFAKLVSLALPCDQLSTQILSGFKEWQRQIPLACLPTTAGSGSEITPFAVCYIDGIKHAIDAPSIRPDIIVLEPEFLANIPDWQIAVSGIDAVCQAIESLISKKATAISRSHAKAALSLAVPVLQGYFAGQRPHWQQDMQLAANLAGQAISVTRTNIPHALSYWLSAEREQPHGLAVAYFMAPFLSRIADHCATLPENPLAQDLFFIRNQLGVLPQDDIAKGWYDLMTHLHLPTHFKAEDRAFVISQVSAAVNPDRAANAPCPMDIPAIVAEAIIAP